MMTSIKPDSTNRHEEVKKLLKGLASIQELRWETAQKTLPHSATLKTQRALRNQFTTVAILCFF